MFAPVSAFGAIFFVEENLSAWPPVQAMHLSPRQHLRYARP
jgi:hypothetical protein